MAASKDQCAFCTARVTATVTAHDETGTVRACSRVCAEHVDRAAETYEDRGREARVHVFAAHLVEGLESCPKYDGPRVAVAS